MNKENIVSIVLVCVLLLGMFYMGMKLFEFMEQNITIGATSYFLLNSK